MTSTDTLNFAAYPFYQWDSLMAAQTQADTAVVGCTGVSLDSIFPMQTVPDPIYRKSMFTHHSLPVKHDSLIVRSDTVPSAWLFAVLVVLSALLCIYLKVRKINIRDLGHSLIDHRAMDRTLRNNNLTHSSMLTPMGMLATASIATVAYTAAMQYTGIIGFLLLTLALIVAYIVRNGIIRLLGLVFDNQSGVNIYITNNYLYHLALAIIVVPLLFPMIYAPWGNVVVYIIAALVAIEFVMRFSNGIKLFLTQSKDFHFHLFYYLCAVELIPVLVLVKFFIG